MFIKGILIMMGAFMINYLPAWAADRYDRIACEPKRLPRESDKDFG